MSDAPARPVNPALPSYDPKEVAVSLRASPIAIASGMRRDPNRDPNRQFFDPYAELRARRSMHTFDYDPCRSR
jgi:hypothetical protein